MRRPCHAHAKVTWDPSGIPAERGLADRRRAHSCGWQIVSLCIIVVFQVLNVTLSTRTLLAVNSDLLSFQIHSYSLLQVDPLWKFVVLLCVFNFYGGLTGAILHPIVHFLAACATKWMFMGRVDPTKVYGHRSWMHAKWILSHQFLNKSVRVNSDFYQGTGWYAIAARASLADPNRWDPNRWDPSR